MVRRPGRVAVPLAATMLALLAMASAMAPVELRQQVRVPGVASFHLTGNLVCVDRVVLRRRVVPWGDVEELGAENEVTGSGSHRVRQMRG